jgi:hypothetical protein
LFDTTVKADEPAGELLTIVADDVLVEMGQTPVLRSVAVSVALVTLGGLLKLAGELRLAE